MPLFKVTWTGRYKNDPAARPRTWNGGAKVVAAGPLEAALKAGSDVDRADVLRSDVKVRQLDSNAVWTDAAKTENPGIVRSVIEGVHATVLDAGQRRQLREYLYSPTLKGIALGNLAVQEEQTGGVTIVVYDR